MQHIVATVQNLIKIKLEKMGVKSITNVICRVLFVLSELR
jgi:hypothetical protein